MLNPVASGGVGRAMSETMSARVYGDTLVLLVTIAKLKNASLTPSIGQTNHQSVIFTCMWQTDGGGMVAYTTPVQGLLGNDVRALNWTAGQQVSTPQAGFNQSFVAVALRILPGTGTDSCVIDWLLIDACVMRV